jgi:predicted nucleic acid-binding Zn ribbon protein
MPRYDYECTECGAEIEIEHSIKNSAVEYFQHIKKDSERPDICDGKLKRLCGAPMFNFKGGSPTPKFHG